MGAGAGCCFVAGIAVSARWIWSLAVSPMRRSNLSEAELTELEGWLEIPDQQMFAWVNGMEQAPAEIETGLFRRLRDFRGKGVA